MHETLCFQIANYTELAAILLAQRKRKDAPSQLTHSPRKAQGMYHYKLQMQCKIKVNNMKENR